MWTKIKSEELIHERKAKDKYKNCGYDYTGVRNGYPEDTKQKAIKYYSKGNGFRRIERSLCVSRVSAVNWVTQGR